MADASDRGWGPAPAPRSQMVDVRAGAANVAFPGGVHRDIAPLVVELVSRIEVATGERAVPGWCWGYAPRYVRGSTSTWSNHAWGLAIDFNAPAHPMGSSSTWDTPAAVIAGLATDLGFRWGGTYRTRPDEMHFEFMGTPADARRRVAELEGHMARTRQQIAATIASWPPDSWQRKLWDRALELGLVNADTDPLDTMEKLEGIAFNVRLFDAVGPSIASNRYRIAKLEQQIAGVTSPQVDRDAIVDEVLAELATRISGG